MLRSFCYATDEVDGIYKLFMSGDHNPTNVGNPDEYTVRQLDELVVELTGTKSPIVYEPLPKDDPKVRKPDITRAREMLGWEPKVHVRDGLARAGVETAIRYATALGCPCGTQGAAIACDMPGTEHIGVDSSLLRGVTPSAVHAPAPTIAFPRQP